MNPVTNLHHRRSIRLKGYDYTQSGAYFVTVCTMDRQGLFGNVVAGKVQLNEYGSVAAGCWQWLAKQHEYVGLDEWFVMPNHLHGIVMITNDSRGGSRTAPTQQKPLGRLVGAFKTISTKEINRLRHTPGMTVWQRNFYEHIIRDEVSLERICRYIVNNPAQWELDELYPGRVT